ncbi:MAG: threonine synthase [Planctomycetota bacterium]
MTITHLECSACGKQHAWQQLLNLCACGAPLLARYDLDRARMLVTRRTYRERGADLWRYREVLPAPADAEIITLGEGLTPLLELPRLARRFGLDSLRLKDEGKNPTASFKARGMAVAVTMAKHLGARELMVPSAGNAGGALAAYARRAGLAAHIALPTETPRANLREIELLGVAPWSVSGSIADAARALRERARGQSWFDMSTLREPYRLEGKKTMAYELFEQCGAALPDVIVYPTGGGTGLIGMWKGFLELAAMGAAMPMPRFVCVQASGCAPIVAAFEQGLDRAEPVKSPQTIAAGLRVPAAIGDRLMLRALRESRGTALGVSDDQIKRAVAALASEEGVLAAPEGAATLAALPALIEQRFIARTDRVVLFNTGAVHKYFDVV